MNRSADTAAPDTKSPADEAARWFSRRRQTLSAGEEAAFRQWLEADPAHRRAYDEITRAWELAGETATDPRICAMRSAALMIRPERQRRFPAKAAAVAGVVALGAALGVSDVTDRLMSWPQVASTRSPQDYQTAVGERTTITLDDGSVVTLNTNSRMRVQYSKARRSVVLLAGQAFFQVEKDPERPFAVLAGNREIIALGTQFDVRFENQAVRVALLEGKVAVRPRNTPTQEEGDKPEAPAASSVPAATLEPGEQLVTRTDGQTTIAQTDVQNLVSWREGRIRFDNTPLAAAVAEMNRYSRIPIVIEDPRIASIRVSGAFKTGQPASFVAAVTDLLPIVAQTSDERIALRGES